MQEHQHEPYQQPPPAEQQRERYEQQASEQQRSQAQEQAQQQARQAEQQPQQQMPTKQPEQQAKEQFLSPEQQNQYRSRWNAIQIEFVSDPHKSAEDADHLVGEMVQNLDKQLNDQCTKLEQEWQQGKPSTEDLRVTLGHYQSFLDRLLSI